MLSGYEWLFPIQKYIRLKKCPSWAEVFKPQWLSFLLLLGLWFYGFGMPAIWKIREALASEPEVEVSGFDLLVAGLPDFSAGLLFLAIIHAIIAAVEAGLAMGLVRASIGHCPSSHAGRAFRFALSAWPFWCWYVIGIIALSYFPWPAMPRCLWWGKIVEMGWTLILFACIFITAKQAARAMVVCLEAEADEPAGPADVISQ